MSKCGVECCYLKRCLPLVAVGRVLSLPHTKSQRLSYAIINRYGAGGGTQCVFVLVRTTLEQRLTCLLAKCNEWLSNHEAFDDMGCCTPCVLTSVRCGRGTAHQDMTSGVHVRHEQTSDTAGGQKRARMAGRLKGGGYFQLDSRIPNRTPPRKTCVRR